MTKDPVIYLYRVTCSSASQTCDVLFDAVPCIAVLNNHTMVKGTNHKFKCRLQIVFDKCAYPDFNSSLEGRLG